MQKDRADREPLAEDLDQLVTAVCERYSMSRADVANLMNEMLIGLSSASERHRVPFEDMLPKLVWVARHRLE